MGVFAWHQDPGVKELIASPQISMQFPFVTETEQSARALAARERNINNTQKSKCGAVYSSRLTFLTPHLIVTVH